MNEATETLKGQQPDKSYDQMTLSELEADFTNRRLAAAEDYTVSGGKFFPSREVREKEVVKTVKSWLLVYLVPIIKNCDPVLDGDNDDWECHHNATGKFAGLFQRFVRRNPNPRWITVACICGINCRFFAFPEDQLSFAARFVDMVVYHFRHYRKGNPDISAALNGSVASARLDWEMNPGIVRALFHLENFLLVANLIVPHQLKVVKQFSRGDRARVNASREDIKRLDETVNDFRVRICVVEDRVRAIETAVSRLVESQSNITALLETLILKQSNQESVNDEMP